MLKELSRVRYEYDERGNLSRKTEPNGVTWVDDADDSAVGTKPNAQRRAAPHNRFRLNPAPTPVLVVPEKPNLA
ncbi:RHS repeat protein [Caballeronia sp. EK]|uniref:RHS repeat protein n=1 Tax=Caballeronia sp. EK TaxID=2767469 RepID=UPI001654EBFC|nr:RHS repeat protein [Caballeronia sp. EK]MBC8641524.1 RHS repeat protein [Caballeronia sp. EK]